MDTAVSGDRHGGARRSAGRLGTATSRTYTATKQKGHFEGNVAIKELRERMALAPDLAEPPMPDDHEAVFGMVGRSPVSTSWSHHRRATTRFALTAYENRRPGRSRVQCPRDVNAASSNDNSSRSGVAIGLGFHGVDREAAEPVISGVRQSVREFVRVLIDDDKILRGWAALNFWRRGWLRRYLRRLIRRGSPVVGLPQTGPNKEGGAPAGGSKGAAGRFAWS
jgi:hypothetical protein